LLPNPLFFSLRGFDTVIDLKSASLLKRLLDIPPDLFAVVGVNKIGISELAVADEIFSPITGQVFSFVA